MLKFYCNTNKSILTYLDYISTSET